MSAGHAPFQIAPWLAPKTPQPRHPRAPIESLDPSTVRPWRFHNRAESGMDDLAIDALAESIVRTGQQQPGLARRLPPGDTHAAEAVYGVRRLEACRRAGIAWEAEVREATLTDAECAALMHGENAFSEGVSPLENAVQWQAMLEEGVFENQSALAAEIGCHRGTVARAVRTSRALFAEDWLAALVRPVMHEFSGRAADRLADTVATGRGLDEARRRARTLFPGPYPGLRPPGRPLRHRTPRGPVADRVRTPPGQGGRRRRGGRPHPARRPRRLVGDGQAA